LGAFCKEFAVSTKSCRKLFYNSPSSISVNQEAAFP
jgi:hypothetical protein